MKKHHRKLRRLINRHAPHPVAGAEIGVYRGATALAIHSWWPTCVIHFVDTWMEWSPTSVYYQQHRKMGRRTQAEWDVIYAEALQNMRSTGGPFVVHRTTSADAAQQFESKSLDFVFIDAGHTEEEVALDIELWLPKVKRLICGHDYNSGPDGRYWGVTKAVHRAFGKKNILHPGGNVWGYSVK